MDAVDASSVEGDDIGPCESAWAGGGEVGIEDKAESSCEVALAAAAFLIPVNLDRICLCELDDIRRSIRCCA